MAQSFEEGLFQAIKKDDIKAFNALMETTQCGASRLGRFPVLSLLYLYKSRKILSAYEVGFLQIQNYEVLREPVEISKKFSQKAKKCLRLYLNEVVSPLEMLLILDRTRHLTRVFPMAKPSSAVKRRLKSIYNIKYALGVRYEGENIIIDRRPLSYREKRNIVSIVLATVLTLSFVIGVPVTTVSLIPKPVEGEVTVFDQIDFDSTKEYTLKQDIIVPENYSVEKVNCQINGEGRKMIFGKGASLGEFNGYLHNIVIESEGDPLFTSILENALIQNVTINVNASVSSDKSTAFVALNNFGALDNVTVNISGKINALSTSEEATSELTFGGLVQCNNYTYNSATQTVYGRGVINNCTVNYTRLELSGEASANAVFGGIAGINNGYVQNCTVKGEIVANTFDIAGVCSLNNYALLNNVNEANLSQVSADTNWNPIACGIVMTNSYAVENCQNKGKISAVSDCGQFDVQEGLESTASAAGIAYLSRSTSISPYLSNCKNSGEVESSARYRNAYSAGICLSSNGRIEDCKNSGAVKVKTENGHDAYAGGITALAYGYIYKSVNEGDISANVSGLAYVGGISAYSRSQFLICVSKGDITATAKNLYAGGIFGYSEYITNLTSTIRGGVAEYCISENRLNVSVTGDEPAYVGGIAGYVNEAEFESGDIKLYFGGGVTNSFFIGECASEISYFGNIVGVCGANIYASNSYLVGTTQYHNFDGNFYVSNSLNALGSTVTADGKFVSAEDKGATGAMLENIQSSEKYQQILSELES